MIPETQTVEAVIRKRVDEIRLLRGRMSHEELAFRMKDLGFPWHRQTVGQVLSGTRTITAAELVGLAAALGTTVLRLLSPIPADHDEPTPQVDIGGEGETERRPVLGDEIWGLYGFEPPDARSSHLDSAPGFFEFPRGLYFPAQELYDRLSKHLESGWVTPERLLRAAVEAGFTDEEIRTLTTTEFKAWLEGDPTPPGGTDVTPREEEK